MSSHAMSNAYGAPVSLEDAKKAAAAALAVARQNNWTMAVAVVDPGGNLVYFEKMDNTQLAGSKIAIDKARSAAIFKRPTKIMQDMLASGGAGVRVLRLRGAIPIEGGLPLFIDGKIEGSITLPGNRVTVGRNGQVASTITAREIVILGKVRGNIAASDRVDIRAEGALTGDVTAARISIEDGAFFKGGIDIRKADANAKPAAAVAVTPEAPKPVQV